LQLHCPLGEEFKFSKKNFFSERERERDRERIIHTHICTNIIVSEEEEEMATTNMEENTISFSERDVELRLKLGLWGRRYTNLEIHKINNKHLRVQFENRNTKTSRVVVTWARSQESATTIAKRGFEIEREGKTFSVSSPNPCLTTTTHKNQAKDEKEDERDKNNEMKEQKDSHDDSNIVTAFLCAVDVGKSVPVSRSRDRGIDSSLERPCDSDSIHICRKSLAELSDAFGNVVKTTSMQNEKQHSKDIIEGDYDHTYVIYEPTQILPLYMVRFRLEPKEDSKVAMICMNCEIEPAVMHCPQCDAKLCSECDTKHHNQKLLRGHKRYRIARDGMTLSMEEDKSSNGGFSSLTIRSMCPKHPKQSVQFFDPILHVPVCIHCKMTGSHARGEVCIICFECKVRENLFLHTILTHTHTGKRSYPDINKGCVRKDAETSKSTNR